ncbi:MAG TPA: DUF3368 domain-containing protein [Ktedonobacterales bacterium]
MSVISNTSPIINLAAVGQLDLLGHLYGHILIPQAVYDEIVTNGASQPGALEVRTSAWIELRALARPEDANQWLAEVDAGEAEAIALSLAVGADRLLIDERLGRALASRLGIPIMGTLGTLVAAKAHGHITVLKPIMDDLIHQAHFWIAPDLYQKVLDTVGEQ